MEQRQSALEDMVDHSFSGVFKDKRVLVTGHTGFKGGWLGLWLHHLGAEVFGYALPPLEGCNFFDMLSNGQFARSWTADLRDAATLQSAVKTANPNIIFHLAAQPLVGMSYREPLETFTTNAVGTAMLLEAVRNCGSSAAVVIVTSDKCYKNDNTGRPFREDDPLGGNDPYSMSKAVTEMVVASWHTSFFSKSETAGPLATGRAGNVIGGGDYAEDRIIPDAVRAYQKKEPLVLRRPHATRPWQHVLESVSGYLVLGQRLLTQPERTKLLSFNFGPDSEAERTVNELMDAWLATWPEACRVEVSSQPGYAEAARLSLDNSKARNDLGWRPVWNFHETVAQTAGWYRLRHQAKKDHPTMLAFTLDQIAAYTRDARRASVAWATEL